MVLNVFYRQPKEKQFRDRELENNVTSAFLILLKSNNTFLNYFLDKLNVNSIKQNCKEVIFQVTNKYTIQTKSKENKYLLFINSKYDLRIKDNKGSEHTKSKDIPDGLIFDDKTAILIEAKVSAIKEESQLKRYNKAYFDGSAQTDLTTWQDIYGYILGYSNKYKSLNQCNTCDFLLNEFKGYLEVVNLSGFSGIPFFNKDERYDEKIAGEILKNLIIEIKELDWYEKGNYNMVDRPKVSAWDSFYDKDLMPVKAGEKADLRSIPHNSVYIFEDFYGFDCLFHNKEVKEILKDELWSKFCEILEKLSNNDDYYFRAVDYRKILNKNQTKKGKVRQGVDYINMEFTFQLSRFIKKHKDWQSKLRSYFDMLLKEDPKQFGILKKAYYKDKEYTNLSNPTECINFMTTAEKETKELCQFILEIYKTKNHKK